MSPPAPPKGRGAGGNFNSSNELALSSYTAPDNPSTFAHLDDPQDPSCLCEPLRRLQWLRQELDLWNEAHGAHPMPQPRDFGIPLPNLRPSDVHFWRAAS